MFCLLWKPLAPRRVRPEAALTWVSGAVPHGLGLQSAVCLRRAAPVALLRDHGMGLFPEVFYKSNLYIPILYLFLDYYMI